MDTFLTYSFYVVLAVATFVAFWTVYFDWTE